MAEPTATDAYDDLDGVGLADLVRRGEVSPLELVDAAIARVEARNPALNAVVHRSFERARDAARGDLPAGPFRGVPFLLKDLNAEDAGQPSTHSTKLLTGFRPDHDAELVARYKRAGLVIIGRTNTPEFGIYGVTEPALRGPTRNPWDPGHTPGGSSGGSGAAVAARMVPMAHAGDGGGSIRIPASHCGLVGLKPTRARNPAGPDAGERWGGFVSEHVLTRSVRDAAAMLDATAGPDPGAPYQVRPPERPFLAEVGADPGKLRIAFTTRALFGKETHPDCVAAVEDAARLAASLGHEVEEAHPTFDREALVRAYFAVVAAGTARGVAFAAEKAGVRPRARDFEPATWLLKSIADKLTATEYAAAIDLMQRTARDLVPFFARYDVLLTPTTAFPPAPIGAFAPKGSERFLLGVLRAFPLRALLLKALDTMAEDALAATPNTMLFNMTGQPAISLPLSWNGANLPIGTQWVGRFGDEATLLRLAASLEAARPWAGRVPPGLSAPANP
ncbi:MAG: amidase [Deltaproteobacteria bacterium]|nr:amidase [Deltaproteobacteria bacterium]